MTAYHDRRRRLQQRRERQNLAELQDLKQVVESLEGARLLGRWLRDSGVFAASFAEPPVQMAFREGQRSLGLQLLRQLQAIQAEPFHLLQSLEEESQE